MGSVPPKGRRTTVAKERIEYSAELAVEVSTHDVLTSPDAEAKIRTDLPESTPVIDES